MKKIYFTPGPSQLYPTVESHIKNALKENIMSRSHRSLEFEKLYLDTTQGISRLLKVPNNYQIFFLSSAIEAMERIIQNVVINNSLHVITGDFGDKFLEIAKDLEKNTVALKINIADEISNIKVPIDSELICITQNETSNGFNFPLEKVYKIKQQNPDKLIALDIVSSVPFVKIDFRMVDLVFFSVQKGFGLPSGLAILILSPSAIKKSKQIKLCNKSIGSFHSFVNLEKYALKNQTYETPNVLNIYLLNKVIKDMEDVGIDAIRKQISNNADRVYEYLENSKLLSPLILKSSYRSQTVLVIKGNNINNIYSQLQKKGLIIGKGYGKLKNETIRIANFPAHSEKDFDRLIRQLQIFENTNKFISTF